MNLYIFGVIDDAMVNRTIKKIVETPEEDEYIVVYVNSEGGERDCDTAIYEALTLSGKHIISYAAHQVYSAAMTIYLAGDERYAHSGSRFMIHEVYHDIVSEKKTMENYRRGLGELDESTSEYFKLIANRTQLTITRIKNKVQKALEGDWFFKLGEAQKLGIVTGVGLPIIPPVQYDEVVYMNPGENDDEEEVDEEVDEEVEEVEEESLAASVKGA